MVFVFLDHQFHCTTTAINALIDKAAMTMFKVGHDKAGIRAFVIMLGFDKNSVGFCP